ncbi:Asp23/Gls24 family envelope stress response protein [Kitasatospora sp. NA04385]|uniref:Asp23/Gls24 family envelope stress response protein n=1 Tax=Kitasatospora sp. NA04385 TaxID=2742135 RepID=UPI00159113B3|nr:Asp23/Gls24 family envelope stress response protein [Kitasatospora sp. NA04385]QKW17943.1 Asp23/Gls24 family envelope stress response protein [Kitasatospora sp. NA04385]
MVDPGNVRSPGSPSQSQPGGSRPGADAAPEGKGKTSVADGVVAKIAGTAAREVAGVHTLGAGMSRALGAVRDRVPGGGGSSVTRGVKVEVGERQAAVDLEVVVEYGVPVPEVAKDVRASVIEAVERLVGLEVVEVNIAVKDVHLPGEKDEDDEDDEGGAESREATGPRRVA